MEQLIAGVDEVGRGPLAGPVIAAAVILDPSKPIEGLRDSKKLSEKKRESLFIEIKENALAVAVAQASVAEIDDINILHASLLAMRRAVLALDVLPNHALVDGNKLPDLPMTAEAIVQGDTTHAPIQAASIIAKVTRDRMMVAYEQTYPGYGLAQHKGYPTKAHVLALEQLGVTEIHRRTFSPVAKILKRVR